MIQSIAFRQLLLITILLLLPLPALASSTIDLSFAGNSSYILSGAEIEDAGRIEATITYDTSLFGNPRLIPKSSFADATVTLDGDISGTLRLIVTSTKPMKGNGLLATLVFDPLGTSIGYIKSLSGRVYGMNGSSLIASFSLTNPTPQLDPSDPDDLAMIKEREAKGQSFMGGEVAYLPPEVTETKEHGEQDETSVEAKDTAAASGKSTAAQSSELLKSPLPEKAAKSLEHQTQSVLERFRLFKGERTAKNLMELFDAAPDVPFRQEPPIFLADGKSGVRVTISKVSGAEALNFTFNSAHYLSSKKLSEGEWLIAARPEKGALSASITILTNGSPRKIPLTVAPQVRVDLITRGKVSEADFALFLKERGTKGAPRFDLNGDGKRDYLDDYIFTANYLVALEKQAGEKRAVQQAAVGMGEAVGARLKKN